MESKKLMLALASFILATSCSNQDSEIMPQVGETVDFTASMKTVSRATETTFEEGDKIGVYAVNAQANTASILQPSGNYADNVRYTYNNGKFINAQGIVRPTDSGLRYYAIYPYTTPCGPTFKFNVKTNQNASGQYTLSDLCTAVSDITSNKEVDLVFSHRLSHVVVNLQGELLGTGTATVRLNNVNTGCDADLNANTFTAYESRNTVYCADNGTNSYKAIIAPQTIEDGSAFLTVSLNGKEHTLKASSDIRLTSGKQQVFNLTIEKDEIVSFTGEILPWGENEQETQKVGIYSLEDLVAFRDARNAGEDVSRWKNENGEINIYEDIDLSSIEYWEPISEIESHEVLNGNGHTIRLKMVKTMRRHDDGSWGFIYLNRGEIKNMNLESYLQIDSEVENGAYFTNYSIGSICIENCGIIEDSNVLLFGDSKVQHNSFGGIACHNSGVIESCIAEGTIEVGIVTAGGICAINHSIIKTCTNRLSFNSNAGGDCVGGITGYHSNMPEMYDCINEANITFVGGYAAGGLIGRMYCGKVDNCINRGNITGERNAVGGIVGNASESPYGTTEQGTRIISKCTNQGQITGKVGVTGGIVGAIAGAKSIVEECSYEGTVNGVSGSMSNAIGSDLR